MTGLDPHYASNMFLEMQQELEISPSCAWDMSVKKRRIATFWKRTLVRSECTKVALWVVTFSIRECLDHAHFIFLCSKHKKEIHQIDIMDCPRLGHYSINWEITKIEKM